MEEVTDERAETGVERRASRLDDKTADCHDKQERPALWAQTRHKDGLALLQVQLDQGGQESDEEGWDQSCGRWAKKSRDGKRKR